MIFLNKGTAFDNVENGGSKYYMTLEELEKKLAKSYIPSDMYSLKGGLPNEAYCVEKKNGKWHVYYSEHGIKITINNFTDEESAANCLWDKIKERI